MLEIDHLSKSFNKGTVNEKKALQDLSLKVEDGEFVTILGSNGAGKSTLFNAIAGTFMPDAGRIILDGRNITYLAEYKRAAVIGRLFQDPMRGTAPHMTICENLALAYLRAKSRRDIFSRISKKDREFFREKLKMLNMGLEDRMDVPVGTLSGGQRQALTLLMAVIVPPRLLLLDEHTAALDPLAAEKVIQLTQKIVEENHTTCLMITHNLEQALHIGSRTLMMHEGHIISDISGEKRRNMTVQDLMASFHQDLDDDRILLH